MTISSPNKTMEEHVSERYRSVGVDTAKGQSFVANITPLVAKTRGNGVNGNSGNGVAKDLFNGVTVTDSLGGFGGLFDLAACGFTDPILVAASDGVGSKVMLSRTAQHRRHMGIDVVAMCVNDIVAMRARPLFFLDYYACSQLQPQDAQHVIEGIVQACQACSCACIGGETAEMPGLYPQGHYDIAGFAVGAIERKDWQNTKPVAVGDCLFALPSSGLHANGFSLVRSLLKDSAFAKDNTFIDRMLEPTRLYVAPCLDMMKRVAVKAFAHITGGGLPENILRILPRGQEQLTIHIDMATWQLPPLFRWLAEQGQLNEQDLRATFNCGIGMVIACAASQREAIRQWGRDNNETLYEIGHITAFDGKPLRFHNQDSWWLDSCSHTNIA